MVLVSDPNTSFGSLEFMEGVSGCPVVGLLDRVHLEPLPAEHIAALCVETYESAWEEEMNL